MKYLIKVDKDALEDIQSATDWYNEQLQGLGTRFQKQVITQINSLESSASMYSIRYANVHCMLIKKFPFMVHYTLDSTLLLVEVFAVIHTSRNPKIWEQRRNL